MTTVTTRYRFIKRNGKQVKRLKKNKDIPVSLVSVKQFEEGGIIKDTILEVTFRIEAEPGKYDRGEI